MSGALVPGGPAPEALPTARLLAAARAALAAAQTLPEVARLIDHAEVIRVAARRARLSRAAQNDWSEFRLDAERKGGVLLRAMAARGERSKGGRPKTADMVSAVSLPDLVALGVATEAAAAQQRSHRWQQLASLSDTEYAVYKAETRASDDPEAIMSRAGAIAWLRRQRGTPGHAGLHAGRIARFEAGAIAGGELPYDMIVAADADRFLEALPAGSAHTCVTSPSYWAKRRYTQHAAELGQEAQPADYVTRLCATVDRIGRVLVDGGLVFLNLGDTYASQPGGYRGDPDRARGVSERAIITNQTAPAGRSFDVPPKSLLGIPWRVLLELIMHRGWRCANVIAWVKPNHQPENVFDRFTQAWEPILVLTRSEHAYLRREQLPETDDVWVLGAGRRGAAEGHLAPFPDALVERAIEAACPEGGVVLDPFAGSGTALAVAGRLGRRFLGCDLLATDGAAG